MSRNPTIEEQWRDLLSGAAKPVLQRYRHIFRRIPSQPRCKVCNAPFGGAGGTLMRVIGREPWPKNPHYCTYCIKSLSGMPGGAEIQLSFLFADVRGSTALAEGKRPAEFTRLMNRFFSAATHVVIESDGLVEKLIGDEVAALYIPGYVGPDHAAAAIDAAAELLRATGHQQAGGPWIPVGVGVHTGTAFVGMVGSDEGVTDFTALGDAVNMTARLAGLAAAGEVLVSEAAAAAAGRDLSSFEQRHLALKGHSQGVDVRVLRVASPAAVS